MKPVINLDELNLESEPEKGHFQQSYGIISDRIGAKKLGYNLTIVPPGKRGCPFHNHHNNEEMIFIVEGNGVLRFGEREYPLRKHDVVAFPPGGREVAHQVINTGKQDLKYLALSTKDRTEVCEYPDSNKVGVFVGDFGQMDLRKLFVADQTVSYDHGEV
jgi:uncharacterized cupin superfamily protein